MANDGRSTVKIDETLHSRLKRISRLENKSVREILTLIIEGYVDKYEKIVDFDNPKLKAVKKLLETEVSKVPKKIP